MSLRKATIRKEGEEWIAEYESDAIPTIEGKSTQKHPDIKVDIGMKLEPMKVHYAAEKYPLEQVIESTKARLETDECEMCEREQKVVAAFVSGLYDIKEKRIQLQRERVQAPVPKPEEKPRPIWPIFPRPSLIVEIVEELEKGS